MLAVVKAKNHVPFLDMAYQGFGAGIDEDAAAVRLFAESGLTFFASSSFSKSFSCTASASAPCRSSANRKKKVPACCPRSSA